MTFNFNFFDVACFIHFITKFSFNPNFFFYQLNAE